MANGTDKVADGWMSDVQRALALILIGTVAFMVIALTVRIVISGDLPTIASLLKELKDALTNMSLIALGFFFGNTMAKMAQDKSQQDLVQKMTPTAPGTPSAVPVPPWWAKLTEDEKNAIAAAMKADPRIDTIKSAMTAGAATPEDLQYLVAANLLTQDRADAIQKAGP